jgi:phosphatidylinositol 4-kinase type 2
MALRSVFSQDSDFKEGMFARQIAVMKGQAWNVVETLKQADHGPLELTRRTRVCVWDDLVDIPVAIPLRVPSAEMKRRRDSETRQQEEMDIGAAYASAPAPAHDLLSMGSPTSELPNPNRFELSRDQSSADLGRIHEEPGSPATISDLSHMRQDAGQRAKQELSNSLTLPPRPANHPRSKTRSSLDYFRSGGRTSNRRYSSSHYRRGSNPILYDRDDLEGDLGYAAAEGMEGNEKKVIVERLETVKSSNPVFTWC